MLAIFWSGYRKSHFQSSETTSMWIVGCCDGIGFGGSRSCEPIQAMPPRNSTTSVGIDQTTSSIGPEYDQSGRYSALALPDLNHQAKASVRMMTGMTTASMIAVALSRMSRSAAAIGPWTSSTPIALPPVCAPRNQKMDQPFRQWEVFLFSQSICRAKRSARIY